jgi:hypothetical protein
VQAAKIALLLHLSGSGLTADRIQSCPLCSAIFILGSHARQDRDHYCSIRCSRYAATKIYRARGMLKTGKGIDEIAKQMELKPKWLEKKLQPEIGKMKKELAKRLATKRKRKRKEQRK